jgi:hypothetical protein
MSARYKVVGISRNTGNYEGNDYDNTYLHVVYEDEKVQGQAVDNIKVKTSVFKACPVSVGAVVKVGRNKYGQVDELENVK